MYDLAVIGGGINGCGIARDAVGRGLRVLLVEKNDLASGTSSASTKLVHGGLRYLEHYEFRLVRESLMEREVLMSMAPHIIWPMRFVLPHHNGLRPAWLIRLGLFLYDHLGGRDVLPGCRTVNLVTETLGAPLDDGFRKGFEYSDCWVDDARLVILNARDAADRGADIRVRTALTNARREADHWQLSLQRADGSAETETARAVINAAGPWVADVLERRIGGNEQAKVRLVRGSHIVVPRQFDHDHAYIFQNTDGRIVFAIPYEDDFTLIGTTDVDVQGDPEDSTISQDEIDYLCAAVSGYFKSPIKPDDIVWTYAGIRPLYDEGDNDGQAAQKATRDYVLDFRDGGAPLLNVFGGKITTYRCLAEEAMGKFAAVFPAMTGPWTKGAVLPGGDVSVDGHAETVKHILDRLPDLDRLIAVRWARTYGAESLEFAKDASSAKELGKDFGGGLYQAEVDHLISREWAQSVDDILWRRTKLGLRLSAEQQSRLATYLAASQPAASAADQREGTHG